MRRVLGPRGFAKWLAGFLPAIPRRGRVATVRPVSDESDGKLVHLHGLICRARGTSRTSQPRCRPAIRESTRSGCGHRNARAGIGATLADAHYAGDHWLPTFAIYLLTVNSRSAGTRSARRTRASGP